MRWVWTDRPATIEEIKAEVGPGWNSILERLVDDLIALGWNGELAQVKEKFGGLRFYIEQTDDKFRDRISIAQQESYRTCEQCGKPGLPRGKGWIKTLCDEHADGRPEETFDW